MASARDPTVVLAGMEVQQVFAHGFNRGRYTRFFDVGMIGIEQNSYPVMADFAAQLRRIFSVFRK